MPWPVIVYSIAHDHITHSKIKLATFYHSLLASLFYSLYFILYSILYISKQTHLSLSGYSPSGLSLRRSTPPNFSFTPDSFLFYFYFELHLSPVNLSNNPFQVSFAVSFCRSTVCLLICCIFHFLFCPFERVFSLPLSLSPFSAVYSLRCPPLSVSLLFVCLNLFFSGC